MSAEAPVTRHQVVQLLIPRASEKYMDLKECGSVSFRNGGLGPAPQRSLVLKTTLFGKLR